MNATYSNPCTRCGKERIVVRTWTEEVEMFYGKSITTHTETACPDAECQKIVEEKNNALRAKKVQMEQDREERMKRTQASRKRTQ